MKYRFNAVGTAPSGCRCGQATALSMSRLGRKQRLLGVTEPGALRRVRRDRNFLAIEFLPRTLRRPRSRLHRLEPLQMIRRESYAYQHQSAPDVVFVSQKSPARTPRYPSVPRITIGVVARRKKRTTRRRCARETRIRARSLGSIERHSAARYKHKCVDLLTRLSLYTHVMYCLLRAPFWSPGSTGSMRREGIRRGKILLVTR